LSGSTAAHGIPLRVGGTLILPPQFKGAVRVNIWMRNTARVNPTVSQAMIGGRHYRAIIF
jgi:hypothetical protein